jgi:hypothetical protein
LHLLAFAVSGLWPLDSGLMGDTKLIESP